MGGERAGDRVRAATAVTEQLLRIGLLRGGV